jgi:hypothetical protein
MGGRQERRPTAQKELYDKKKTRKNRSKQLKNSDEAVFFF